MEFSRVFLPQDSSWLPLIFKLLKLSGCLTERQVQHLKILHGAHIEFMCSLWNFLGTAFNRLVLYNKGGECLQRGTHRVFI